MKAILKKVLPTSVIFTILIIVTEILSFQFLNNVYYDHSVLCDYFAIPILLIGILLSGISTAIVCRSSRLKLSLFSSIITLFLSIMTIVFILTILPGLSNISQSETIYTTDFSWEKFQSITTGMSKNQVRQSLGEPFEVKPYQDKCWQYSEPKTGLSDFLGWDSVSVCFKDNQVSEKSELVFFN